LKGKIVKIAIDIDSITEANQDMTEFISVLTNLLIADHSIFILTDSKQGSEQDIAVELDLYDIDYSDIVITDDKAEFIQCNKVFMLLVASDGNVSLKTASDR
jgi:hypothetical protein